MSDRRAPDRRVVRTQTVLRDALIALIHERGWDAVSVQDICARADVGRSTFYVHFADKEELLLSGFDLFSKQLREHVAARAGEPLAFLRPLIEHVREHQQLYRALVGKRSHQAVRKEFMRVVLELVDADVAQSMASGPQRSAAGRYLAGALTESLVWWLDNRTGLDAAEIERVTLRLSRAVLNAAPLRPARGR